VEIQGRWIVDLMQKMERHNIRYISAKLAAERKIVKINNLTLFPTTISIYMGGGISDKVYEPVFNAGGIPAYTRNNRAALDPMEGFEIVTNEMRDGRSEARL
jgi:hypothetical protein